MPEVAEKVRAMARDLTGRAGLAEVCADMSTLAEVALASAVALHHPALAADFGEPRDEGGEAQALVIVGMGKLGGGELNVSSDIDIVFIYPDDGETDGRRTLGNREFFERLGRRVIGALNEITPEGFVFRVDTRLRPYGESGPLAQPVHAEWIRSLRDQCHSADVAFFFKQWGGRTSKSGGNRLDGRQWLQYPELAAA